MSKIKATITGADIQAQRNAAGTVFSARAKQAGTVNQAQAQAPEATTAPTPLPTTPRPK